MDQAELASMLQDDLALAMFRKLNELAMSVGSRMKKNHWSLTLEVVGALEAERVAVAVLLVKEELEQQEQVESLWLGPVVEALEWKSSCTEILVQCQVFLLKTCRCF